MTAWRWPHLTFRSVEGVPARLVVVTAAASAGLAAAGLAQGYPLYVAALMGLAPWAPAFIMEARREYKYQAWMAFFFAITVIQVGHLSEHGIQVAQLLMSGGTLMHSHGVFGQLDFEAIHFFWDTAIWWGTLALFWRYGRSNGWLAVSLLFASIHEVEHSYLYYVYLTDFHFYQDGGGFAGVLSKGGMLPTVERPYLHFAYNFMVVVPMMVAYAKQLVAAGGLGGFGARDRAGTEARPRGVIP